MKVYIKSLGNFPIEDWGVTAFQGFRAKGADIVFFEDIKEVPLNRNSLVVSDIKDTRYFFKEMGWNVREDISLPEELIGMFSLWKRDINIYSNSEIDYNVGRGKVWESYPKLFCKPLNIKKFQPGVIETEEQYYEVFKTGEEVIISEVVNFVSEYRCFIIDKKIKSCQFYLGDMYKYPDLTIVDRAIENYKSAPIGYSIDVGVLDTGETAIVELNDGWSLGSYGCPHLIYSRLLAERWIEILKQNPIVF